MLFSSRSLLIVDDEAHVVSALTRLLRGYCDEVLGALCGEEALEILSQRPVAVVMSDSLTPPVTGLDLFRRLKAAQPTSRTILLSGQSKLTDVREAKRQGIVDLFIPKPWENDMLIETIDTSFAITMAKRR